MAKPQWFAIEEFPADTARRFRSLVDVEGMRHPAAGQCHEWTGSRVGGGYGTLRVGPVNVRAHRLAWMIDQTLRSGATLDLIEKWRTKVRE